MEYKLSSHYFGPISRLPGYGSNLSLLVMSTTVICLGDGKNKRRQRSLLRV